MKRILYALMLVSVSAAWLCSCGSDSSSSYSMSASGDCAITAVTMGTMTRTVFTTTAAGADTSYNVAVAGAAYPMFVDQIKMDIYNPDSLPVNTNVRKVVLSSISADGIIAYRTPYGNDSLFSTRDTLDFTDPVFFTCFSSDGTQSKTYRMTVNVHKSNSEDVSWTTEADGVSLMEGVSSQKAFVSNGRLMVFALSGGQPVLLKASTDNAGEWESSPISGLEDLQPAGVQMFGGCFYYVADGSLMRSADGETWEQLATEQPLLSLVAVGRDKMYARGEGGIYSSADGEEWEAEQNAGEISGFPAEDVVSVWGDMSFNSNFTYVLACGKTADGQVSIWKKIDDANGTDSEPWQSFPQGESGSNDYPALPQTVLLPYDGKIVCAGLNGGEVSNFYLSSDGGRSWAEQTSGFTMPQGLEAESFSMATDEDNFIWIVCAPSGRVVKGRLNRLGYDKQQRVFEQ